ncbi:MAG TPA: acetyl/propionyl/methylcrotonyl-CoA carboxylase subunit alpha [Rhizomicrobium sp.]
MFKKILIANRGEIACRVIRTARRMGIATVAVYSEADVNALHVDMADEAVEIGAAPAAQSYLNIESILSACRATGTDAVHPGYGFLSERERFVEALAGIGVSFIGPHARAIAAMGDKIESKKLAREAGVSIVPGFVGEIRDGDHAKELAHEIGYPVMIKASAGGGGKGLRIVHRESELLQAMRSSQNEARASFGDDRMFVEKYVAEPRHIEIQVIGDKHGHVIHLNERECSIQRRHQKVVEEAPSPFLDAAMRASMGGQAVALARAVAYDSAGTVEFIVDRDRNFYFLEMNTRLQVEHPVTELVTGFDIVEMMIRSAAGEPLSVHQEGVRIEGWALESRIYAEDPYRGFLPSTGRLVRYRPPKEGPRGEAVLRNDTGVCEGAEISIYYDPMIAKLCSRGPSRAAAIEAMADALDEFRIEGISHNIDFLASIVHHPRFREGRLSTGFIAEEFPEGFHGRMVEGARERRFAAAAVAVRILHGRRASAISGTLDGPMPPLDAFAVWLEDRQLVVSGASLCERHLRVIVDGVPFEADVDWCPGSPIIWLVENDVRHAIQLFRLRGGYLLSQGGSSVSTFVYAPRAADLASLMRRKSVADTSKYLLCPMPGLVVSVNVSEGQDVKIGETLAVVEAMKMENVLTAEREGTIKKVNTKKGASLALDDVILEFA